MSDPQRKGGHIVIEEEEDSITTDSNSESDTSVAATTPPKSTPPAPTNPSSPANTRVPGSGTADTKNKNSAAGRDSTKNKGKATRRTSSGNIAEELDRCDSDGTTMMTAAIPQQSSSLAPKEDGDHIHDDDDDEAKTALWDEMSQSTSSSLLSEPCALKALSMCLCALAAEGQEPPHEVGQFSTLLRYDLGGDDRDMFADYCSDAQGRGGLCSDLDLLAVFGSGDDSYGSSFDTDIPDRQAMSGSSDGIGRETAAAELHVSVNSSDFEERLAREQEGGAGQDQELGDVERERQRQRVVFVHDVPVYL